MRPDCNHAAGQRSRYVPEGAWGASRCWYCEKVVNDALRRRHQVRLHSGNIVEVGMEDVVTFLDPDAVVSGVEVPGLRRGFINGEAYGTNDGHVGDDGVVTYIPVFVERDSDREPFTVMVDVRNIRRVEYREQMHE